MAWTRYIPAGILAIGAALIFAIGTPRATPLLYPLDQAFPIQWLGTNGVDVPIGPDEQRVSGVTAYLNRAYDFGNNDSVLVYVGYHATQQGSGRMHSPSLCLPGAGWNSVSAQFVTVPVGPQNFDVNRYVLQKGRHRILVYYWFQGRGRVTAGETRLKLNALIDALVSHRDEEALVRIVVPVATQAPNAPVGNSGLHPDTLAVRLASAMIPSLQRVLPPAP